MSHVELRRWQQLENVYHAALERDAEERVRFLDEACRDDEFLRKEVQSLLTLESEAAEFFASTDQPSVPFAAFAETSKLERFKSWLHRNFISNAKNRNRHSGRV